LKCGLWIWFVILAGLVTAQDVQQDTLAAYVVNGDTLYVTELPEVTVTPKPRTDFKNRRQRRDYGRLLRDVKKTLPYAKMAGGLLVEVNDSLHSIESKKEQDQYLKVVEKELFAEYEPALRKMSMRQGRMLIKLIDRECQVNSYEVVIIYRGRFSAFFWQGVARIFGSDLKSSYDADGEDALIEEVVLLVEAGII
jgi:hypothetical protein